MDCIFAANISNVNLMRRTQEIVPTLASFSQGYSSDVGAQCLLIKSATNLIGLLERTYSRAGGAGQKETKERNAGKEKE